MPRLIPIRSGSGFGQAALAGAAGIAEGMAGDRVYNREATRQDEETKRRQRERDQNIDLQRQWELEDQDQRRVDEAQRDERNFGQSLRLADLVDARGEARDNRMLDRQVTVLRERDAIEREGKDRDARDLKRAQDTAAVEGVLSDLGLSGLFSGGGAKPAAATKTGTRPSGSTAKAPDYSDPLTKEKLRGTRLLNDTREKKLSGGAGESPWATAPEAALATQTERKLSADAQRIANLGGSGKPPPYEEAFQMTFGMPKAAADKVSTNDPALLAGMRRFHEAYNEATRAPRTLTSDGQKGLAGYVESIRSGQYSRDQIRQSRDVLSQHGGDPQTIAAIDEALLHTAEADPSSLDWREIEEAASAGATGDTLDVKRGMRAWTVAGQAAEAKAFDPLVPLAQAQTMAARLKTNPGVASVLTDALRTRQLFEPMVSRFNEVAKVAGAGAMTGPGRAVPAVIAGMHADMSNAMRLYHLAERSGGMTPDVVEELRQHGMSANELDRAAALVEAMRADMETAQLNAQRVAATQSAQAPAFKRDAAARTQRWMGSR